ncbi:hypothetical protein G6F66_014212 [Rhizopus arrhizus]|nr:hypothetical protein G6F66_014212 [Rhizopus arrhizus]
MTCSARLPVYALLIGPGAVRPVCGRHPQCAGDVVDHEEVAPRQERASADAGTAVVPPAACARPGGGPVRARHDLPQARRRHHPGADHPAVGAAVVPGGAGGRHAAGHRLQLRRPDRPRDGGVLRAAGLQLADLHRADPGPGRARSGRVLAGHCVRAVGGR